ncbi:unnamed protein product [Ranitomeya imitator]|uniref:Ig-like domain-containing protein n=1 Tax=Ranitomeya imitator TaxID=111125 RepID=A0ABN9MPD7_9NEOB|nr:unnamed protein product [Ranitomeya imitator]
MSPNVRSLVPTTVSLCDTEKTVFLLSSAVGLVTPVISMEQVDGMLGHSVNFEIPISLPPQYRIDWNCGHTGKVIVIARLTSGGSPQYNPLYKERTELMENGTLRLNNISFADESTYKTKVFNPVTFNSYVQRYQLTIYSKLTTPLLILNRRSPLISGTDVTLQCDAESQTVTSYTFYRDGQKIICSEPHVICKGSFLDFTSITEHDTGSYTCTIQNPVSSNTSDSIAVTVSVPVSSVTLTSNASGLLWPGRDSVSLHCSARGTNVSYSWSKEDAPLPESSQYHLSKNNSTLIINQVSSDDTKLLTCTASNWVNTETSNKLDFKFAWNPEGSIACISDPYDSRLQIYCSWPGGQPAANVTMIFNNIVTMGQNEVTRNVPFGRSVQKSNLTCISNHLQKRFSCTLLFDFDAESEFAIFMPYWYPIRAKFMFDDQFRTYSFISTSIDANDIRLCWVNIAKTIFAADFNRNQILKNVPNSSYKPFF